MELEFQRNKERFAFLKWGSNAFTNMLVVPPGSGIVHQVWGTQHLLQILGSKFKLWNCFSLSLSLSCLAVFLNTIFLLVFVSAFVLI